jgi:D-alanyl-lipoteichoic acid acyltransferase DltB (MBOAT superfamily)
MLFNSPVFIFYFLPLVLTVALLLRDGLQSQPLFVIFLALASLFFYGYADLAWLPLILVSITVNYGFGVGFGRIDAPRLRKAWLAGGLAFNLGLLAYFKYADFFIANINGLLGGSVPLLGVVLPVGISFYTFTQTAFLVDAYQGRVRHLTFWSYVFFVTYFPHLVAGPIIHHAEILPQLVRRTRALLSDDLALGLVIFLIGLSKKLLLADSFAQIATPIFAAADAGQAVATAEAWLGLLAYTLQIYFDFSGYSDMAIGLSRAFGIKLPINFASPYKSASIIEFWRRWHITLSRFLRDYLYIIALGGNRKGPVRRHANLLATMLLGGLWHGAGWGFVIWGALHGAYLIAAHGLRALLGPARPEARLRPALGWALTMLAVMVAWVPFRATTVGGMQTLWAAMVGSVGPEAAPLLEADAALELAGGLAIVLLAPNTQQIMAWLFGYRVAIEPADLDPEAAPAPLPDGASTRWRRALQAGLAAGVGVTAAAGLAFNNQIAEFIYFQF